LKFETCYKLLDGFADETDAQNPACSCEPSAVDYYCQQLSISSVFWVIFSRPY